MTKKRKKKMNSPEHIKKLQYELQFKTIKLNIYKLYLKAECLRLSSKAKQLPEDLKQNKARIESLLEDYIPLSNDIYLEKLALNSTDSPIGNSHSHFKHHTTSKFLKTGAASRNKIKSQGNFYGNTSPNTVTKSTQNLGKAPKYTSM
jgi:hypothetical protein